jgi:hypothetical protein
MNGAAPLTAKPVSGAKLLAYLGFVLATSVAATSSLAGMSPSRNTTNAAGSGFAGVTYSLSDGFDLLAKVILKSDGIFEFSWDGCTGPLARATGKYVSDAASITFIPRSADFRKDVRTFSEKMHRVAWDRREYLIPAGRMLAFVNAINAGYEPRAMEMGLFYLREGDEKRAAVGHPQVPAEWISFLLPKPLTGAVTKVEQRETATQRPIVLVDAGARVGLRPGMNLYAANSRRPHFRAYLTVLEVAPATAMAIVTFQYNHIRVGDAWSTRSGESGLREPPAPPNMALQRTRRPRIRSGRSLRSLGSPLNARPLDAAAILGRILRA